MQKFFSIFSLVILLTKSSISQTLEDSLYIRNFLNDSTSLKISYSKRNISNEFRAKWSKYFNDKFTIVNPNKNFAKTDNNNIFSIFLPSRQLILIAKSNFSFLILYNQGGRAIGKVIILYDKLKNKSIYLAVNQNVQDINDIFKLLSNNQYQILGIW